MTRQMIDELILQRLLDGELSHQERALFLRQIEESPEQWRDIALALLEEKAIQQEIGQLRKSNNTVVIPRLQSALETELEIRKPKPSDAIAREMVIGKEPLFRLRMPPLAIAAALAFVCLGFWGGTILRDRSEGTANSNNMSVQAGLLPVEAGTLRWLTEDKTPVELPVYQVSELNPSMVWGNNQDELVNLQRELTRRGLQLDIEERFFEGQLPDGRQLVVPVRNVNIRSIAQ